MQMIGDVEMRIGLPARRAKASLDDFLAEAVEDQQTLLQHGLHALEIHPLVEDEDAGDHHQVVRYFHMQPGRIDVG